MPFSRAPISLHTLSTSRSSLTFAFMNSTVPSLFRVLHSAMIRSAASELLPTRYTRGERVFFTKAFAVYSPIPLVPPTVRNPKLVLVVMMSLIDPAYQIKLQVQDQAREDEHSTHAPQQGQPSLAASKSRF